MIDVAIAWLLAHPLGSVCVLSVMSVLLAVLLVPRLHVLADHGRPRG